MGFNWPVRPNSPVGPPVHLHPYIRAPWQRRPAADASRTEIHFPSQWNRESDDWRAIGRAEADDVTVTQRQVAQHEQWAWGRRLPQPYHFLREAARSRQRKGESVIAGVVEYISG